MTRQDLQLPEIINGTKKRHQGILLIPLHHRHSGVLSRNPSSRNPWPLWLCRAMNNSKSWTKVRQNWIWTISWQMLDKQFYHWPPTLNSQNLDKTWTFIYPMFVWYIKLLTRKYTLEKILDDYLFDKCGQLFDKT